MTDETLADHFECAYELDDDGPTLVASPCSCSIGRNHTQGGRLAASLADDDVQREAAKTAALRMEANPVQSAGALFAHAPETVQVLLAGLQRLDERMAMPGVQAMLADGGGAEAAAG